MSLQPNWRIMRPGDAPAVFALSEIVHPDFPEREAIYHDRMALFPEGCLVLEANGEIVGYGLAFPARLGSPPPIDVVLGSLPSDANALYVADVAVSPQMRGRGLAEAAIRRLLDLSAPFGTAMLVSVYGTAPFWARFGFLDETAHLAPRKLAPYGEEARYMVRRQSASSR